MTDAALDDFGRPEALTTPDKIKLAQYLETTNVAWLSQMMQMRQVNTWRIEIRSRKRFGDMSSVFRNLGGLVADDQVGRGRYRLSEVNEILHRPDCDDPVSRDTLEGLIKDTRAGALRDRRLTVAILPDGPAFVDGNKRAVAIYEATDPANWVPLPLFVLKPEPGVVIPL